LHSIQRLFLSKAKKPSLAYPMAMTDKVRITPVRVGWVTKVLHTTSSVNKMREWYCQKLNKRSEYTLFLDEQCVDALKMNLYSIVIYYSCGLLAIAMISAL